MAWSDQIHRANEYFIHLHYDHLLPAEKGDSEKVLLRRTHKKPWWYSNPKYKPQFWRTHSKSKESLDKVVQILQNTSLPFQQTQ